MDNELRRGMFRYYDERAPEYEEAYTRGTGTSSISDPDVFRRDAAALTAVVRRFAGDRLIDLACGTAYWLPHYADRCSHITLFDQSTNMLAESRAKVDRLGLADRCAVVRGDLFDYEFDGQRFDCALVGFLLSHVTVEQERLLFEVLERILHPAGRFLVLDSAWSDERARFNTKIERQQRRLNDGSMFEIYKRYCDRTDISRWPAAYGVDLQLEYFGTGFFAVSGRFKAV
jgi:demethylmenaquinone methyltransferase/2-methoxy-6-polyprenyl-1,4-benzoquinol methylase